MRQPDGSKMKDRWDIYKVVARLENGVDYLVKRRRDGPKAKPKSVHVNKLEPFHYDLERRNLVKMPEFRDNVTVRKSTKIDLRTEQEPTARKLLMWDICAGTGSMMKAAKKRDWNH